MSATLSWWLLSPAWVWALKARLSACFSVSHSKCSSYYRNMARCALSGLSLPRVKSLCGDYQLAASTPDLCKHKFVSQRFTEIPSISLKVCFYLAPKPQGSSAATLQFFNLKLNVLPVMSHRQVVAWRRCIMCFLIV